MNADAWSDLLLALVCAVLVAHRFPRQPALALPQLLVGLAAALGVLDFAGMAGMAGPHHQASVFASGAAFPLLALQLAWPQARVAQDWVLAASLAAAGGGAAWLGGLAAALWLGPALAAAAGLAIAVAAPLRNPLWGSLGALALWGGLAASALGWSGGGLNPVQLLHLGLGLGLLCLQPCLPAGQA